MNLMYPLVIKGTVLFLCNFDVGIGVYVVIGSLIGISHWPSVSVVVKALLDEKKFGDAVAPLKNLIKLVNQGAKYPSPSLRLVRLNCNNRVA